MQDQHEPQQQLGEHGALPGAASGPPEKPVTPTLSLRHTLKIHPLANLFPMMGEKEFQGFLADIKVKGIQDPIWVYKGEVIDGRNRLRAAEILNIAEVPTREWNEKGSLLEFIISQNLQRRHLKERQRAMIAARMKPAFEEDAQWRKQWAGKEKKELPVNLPEAPPAGDSRDHAANILGVSGKSVDYACKVLTKGVPALIEAVDSCKMAVSSAAQLAERPREEQERILKGGRDEILKTFRAEREKHKRLLAMLPKEAKILVGLLPPQLDATAQHLLTHFNAGRAKLKWTNEGFVLEMTEAFMDELCMAARKPAELKTLIERGVRLVMKKPNAA
jgi:hypothetical protein